MSPPTTAATLFREVGLLADGPSPWGRRVSARGRGLFIVELGSPLPTAPIELAAVGKWLERVPALRLDGERPTSRALAARVASFWLPSQTVLYIGATDTLGARIAAIEGTVLGDRRPHAGGNWLRTLRLPATTRVWWATADAVEEYEDGLLTAFAAGVSPEERQALPDPDVVLPFANQRRPTGERRQTGLTESLLAEAAAAPAPARRVTVVPDGDAEGARGEPPAPRRRSTTPPPDRSRAAVKASDPPTEGPGTSDANVTAEGAARMRTELDRLVSTRRPEVIARIRAAKELGDLKENADYSAARDEQSFLEGRIQSLEARLRDAVIALAPVAGAGADLGSVVTVEIDGDEVTYTLVGTAEADPGAGRLSVASPVGRALLGAQAGDEVAVQTPRGAVRYRVVSLA